MYGWEKLVLLRHLLDQPLDKTAIAEPVRCESSDGASLD